MAGEDEPLVITDDMLVAHSRARGPAPAGPEDFERGLHYAPPLTLALIAANVAVFAWQLAVGALDDQAALIGAGALVRDRLLAGEYWRLITAMFLHAGVDHVAGNCLVLYVVGMGSEHALGPGPALLTYLASGLGGSMLSLWGGPGPSVGASGAVFGLCGALAAFLYRRQDRYLLRDKRIGFVLLAWAGYQIATGFLDPYIDNFAHIGGLAVGLAAGAMLPPASRKRGS